MKAVIVREFTPFDQAQYGDLPDPEPAEGEVVVDLATAEANFPDILYIEGKYQKKPPFPFSPGLAGAGVVSKLGAGVSDLTVGQRVMVLPYYGTYAEKIALPAGYCFPMPDEMPFDVAAAFGLVYQTAWFALTDRGAMKAGDTVLVLGATGGVGMAAVQIAKALGAGKVIAATRGEEGAKTALGFGADATIDTSAGDLRSELRDRVKELTDGQGADVVIDPVGGDVTGAALRAMAWQGRLVVVGFASGTIPQIGANYLLVKNISVGGVQWTDYRARQLDRVHDAQTQMFDLWRAGKLAPHIVRRLPLADFAEALRALQQAKVAGKIILTIQEPEE
ncbi:NADPH:quinone oxidoreductase family protein [Celeribacter litoreus]|uniref:NADPH:quinone oxidoreductase family protein n=1 Tax=Celeribacter litoreus TaxID=2876714 RepID=UPI001CCF2FB5|nr:NADPH:quinone oxidoreductase family protein [Celeribacter litoreus]MCA0043415.1 NADPH:quinone oxidoreductase family protein [Celeribacter litoreus]